MESVSVSTRSPKGSVSEKVAKNLTANNRTGTAGKNYNSRIICNHDFLPTAQGEKQSQLLEERRDDYFAMNRPMWHHPPTSMNKRSNRYNDLKYPHMTFHLPSLTGAPPSRWYQSSHPTQWYSREVYYPTYHQVQDHSFRTSSYNGINAGCTREHNPTSRNLSHTDDKKKNNDQHGHFSSFCNKSRSYFPRQISKVLLPHNILIPNEISPINNHEKSSKRRRLNIQFTGNVSNRSETPPTKKVKEAEEGFDKLNLLCSATLKLGPLQENPTGCSCPKSRCIALYCDCFKAGRHCDTKKCSCLNCKNTIKESGPRGARSKAIHEILARNPRAFRNARNPTTINKNLAGDQGCNCIRSRCLKLYCKCFQKGIVCNPLICKCVGCLNIEGENNGLRQLAIEMTLEKRPDAFKKKPRTKIIGAGCACKNNQCVKKYCECFRTKLKCTRKCSCRDCKNI